MFPSSLDVPCIAVGNSLSLIVLSSSGAKMTFGDIDIEGEVIGVAEQLRDLTHGQSEMQQFRDAIS